MPHGLYATRTAIDPVVASAATPSSRSKIVIAGSAHFTLEDACSIRDAIAEHGKHVCLFRMDTDFRMQEFRESLVECALLILAIGKPIRDEFNLLKAAKNHASDHPGLKIGVISLDTSGNRRDFAITHIGYPVAFVIKRTPLDDWNNAKSGHLVLIENLIAGSQEIATVAVGATRFSP